MFSYDSFVEAARAAAASAEPGKAVRELLSETVRDPELQAAGLPDQDEGETHLFEDETVSIWSCRFDPDVVMPPHEHLMDVHIGVVTGGEKNIFFREEDGRLVHVSSKVVQPGDVLSLGRNAIHGVTADGDRQSHALHVYIGPLMQIERRLFEWQSGRSVPFTMENFARLTLPPEDLPAY
ncbi:MAG: hypothetical protein RIC87_09950 [Kiloniellales bacterium]